MHLPRRYPPFLVDCIRALSFKSIQFKENAKIDYFIILDISHPYQTFTITLSKLFSGQHLPCFIRDSFSPPLPLFTDFFYVLSIMAF